VVADLALVDTGIMVDQVLAVGQIETSSAGTIH